MWQVQHSRHCLGTRLAESRSNLRSCTSCKRWSSFAWIRQSYPQRCKKPSWNLILGHGQITQTKMFTKGGDAVILTFNLIIMTIVGRLYGFKVITRTFLHFASNSVCIWFEQSRSFSEVSRQNTSLILVMLFPSRSVSLFGLGQSPSLSWGSVSVFETQARL